MKFSLFFIALLIIPISNALVFHNVTVNNDVVKVNTTIKIDAAKSYDIFEISWEIPQENEIDYIKDEVGIISYKKQGNYIVFQTHRLNSNERVINIQYTLKNSIYDDFVPLKKIQLYLSGFENDQTIVNIYANRIISGDASFGFTEYFDDNFAQFVGNGSADIVIYYGYSGREYENYLLFGSTDITAADNAFSIIPNITGLPKPYKRFPVFVLDDSTFTSKIQPWGSATHMRGGLILIKRSIAEGQYNASIILHETMHGFNSKVLKWNQVSPTWFEEGMSSYIEYLSNKHLGLKNPELFGDNKIFKEDGNKIFIKSKGSKTQLWEYYSTSKSFMEIWNPENAETRDFGYAFSELIIRYSVMKNGIEKLSQAYSEIKEIKRPVTDYKESNKILLNALNTNFMPCYSIDFEIFSNCLKEINKDETEIPEIEIKPENITKVDVNINSVNKQKEENLFDGIILFLQRIKPFKKFFS
ncbi:MAG: hypothetical protein QXM68_00985 [Candidatus Aenigmatarchaeota archaeon]|nr:hypothetical protein [Candidatus Aenigmarchaeota archaeon]